MDIHLAPMEGVVNAYMRMLLTEVGGIDRCVTEFMRISGQLLPAKVFIKICPELATGGSTPAGVPVFLQLLGSDPQIMAENAARAAELGAKGIDINFGCPAKCVNRNRGGSILLEEPELLYAIVNAVRRALPSHIPTTAKIRLGYKDSGRLREIKQAISDAGANEITVHARTRDDGYKPPAHWHQIKTILDKDGPELIANGEVWSPQDYTMCREESGCSKVMIGRGLLARPDLACQIKAIQEQRPYTPISWQEVLPIVDRLFEHSAATCRPKYIGGPIKQWLGYLRRHYPEAQQLFEQIKRLTAAADLRESLQQFEPAAIAKH